MVDPKDIAYIPPKQLYDFYKDLSLILDSCIVNNKQRESVDILIIKLMHQYFLFELPEDNF